MIAPRKVEVAKEWRDVRKIMCGRPGSSPCSWSAHDETGGNSILVARAPGTEAGWSLMIFCVRAMRGLKRPSFDARREGQL